MTEREQKIMALLFNSASSDGEIVNAAKLLRGAYNSGKFGRASPPPPTHDIDRLRTTISKLKEQNEKLRNAYWGKDYEYNNLLDSIKRLQNRYNEAIKDVDRLEEGRPFLFFWGAMLGGAISFGLCVLSAMVN